MARRILTLLFLVLCGVAWAQFYYPIQQDAIDFKKRQLLVQLVEEDQKVIKSLKSKYGRNSDELTKRLEVYSQLVQKQNENLKNAISKYWKLNKAIEYKTKAELDELFKDVKSLRQYAYLSVGWKTEFHFKGNMAYPVEVFALVGYVAEAADKILPELKRTPTQKIDYIFKVAFPTDHLESSDYIFAVQQFNYHIGNATAEGQTLERYRTLTFIPPINKAGYELIKKKTLLLPFTVSPEEKREEIKIAYEYPYELAEDKMFEETIGQQFAKYVYVTMVWSDRQNNFAYFIVNASEGIILAELGHKAIDAKAMPRVTEVEKVEISQNDFYKNQIGFSLNNLVQLQHILGPKN